MSTFLSNPKSPARSGPSRRTHRQSFNKVFQTHCLAVYTAVHALRYSHQVRESSTPLFNCGFRPQWGKVRLETVLHLFPLCNIMEFLIMPSVAPALAPPSIIPTMLNSWCVRRSPSLNKCIAPALPAACVRRNPHGCWVVTFRHNLPGPHSVPLQVLPPRHSSVACRAPPAAQPPAVPVPGSF